MSQYSSYGMSPIRRRNPIGLNIGVMTDAFNNMINSLDAKAKSTAQQQSAIDVALSQLPINASEDEWRYNLGNDVRKRIDAVDNPNDKYLTSIRAAGELMARPDVIGRIRAEAEYQNFIKQTQANPNIDQRTKNWALATNPYSYKDITDANGNIVGGTEWKPIVRPIEDIDYNKLLAEAAQLVFKEAGGRQNVRFADAEGNPVNNITDAYTVMFKSGSTWQGIDRNKLNNLLESVIDNTPGARARLDQDWEVLNWEYNTGKIDESNSELFAPNGKRYSKEEWYNNKFGKAVNSMSGMNYTSTIDYDSNYFALKQARLTNSIKGDNQQQTNYEFTRGRGTPIEEADDTFNMSAGKVMSAITGIEKMVPTFTKRQDWITAKNEGNYNKLVEICAKTRFTYAKDKEKREARLNDYITQLKNNATIVSNVLRQSGDKDSYLFNAAFSTGNELPVNNKYTKPYIKAYNDFTKGGEKIQYTFDNNNELEYFANQIGIDLDKYAGNIGENNGKRYLSIPVTDVKNYKALYLAGIDNVNIIDSNGNQLNKSHYQKEELPWYVKLAINSGLMPTSYAISNNPVGAARSALFQIPEYTYNKSNKDFGSKATPIRTYTSKLGSLPRIDMARKRQQLGLIDGADYEREVKDANREALNLIMRGNGSQYKMAILDEDGTVLRFANNEERLKYMNEIQQRLNAETNQEDMIGTYAYANDIGIHIKLPKNYNKSKGTTIIGDVLGSEVVIFDDTNPILNSIKGSTNFRGAQQYTRLRNFNDVNTTLFDGSSIKWNNKTNQVPIFTESSGNSYPLDADGVINKFGMQAGYDDIETQMMRALTYTPKNADGTYDTEALYRNLTPAIKLFNNWIKEYYPTITDKNAINNYFIDILTKTSNKLK